MCESNAYLIKGGEEELVLESVESIEATGGGVTLTSLFGEEKRIRARIKALSLVEHKIVLEPLGAES
jgi:predicted RNA-binding protein